MDGDKRLYPRFSFSEPVSYGQPETLVNGSIAGNISLGGISLKVLGFVPIGLMMELQLPLGTSSKITWTKAQVVRVREISSEDCYEIGLKFINDVTSTKAIGAYIDACQVR